MVRVSFLSATSSIEYPIHHFQIMASMKNVTSSGSSQSGFFKLPLEVRDMIYKMLLTTPYCTYNFLQGFSLRFHLHPEILRVNKQISEEATRTLYQENRFIILQVEGLYLDLKEMPAFRRLSEDRITNPLLRVRVECLMERRVGTINSINVITTSDGLQHIIAAIWNLEINSRTRKYQFHRQVYHGDLDLTLDFNPTRLPRFDALTDLTLKTFEKVNGFRRLVLKGNLKASTIEHLRKHIMEGPFPDDVSAIFLKWYFLILEEAKEGMLGSYWYSLLCQYSSYLWKLRPGRLEGRAWVNDDAEAYWMVHRMRLRLDPHTRRKPGQ
jgi:hypothetical protein